MEKMSSFALRRRIRRLSCRAISASAELCYTSPRIITVSLSTWTAGTSAEAVPGPPTTRRRPLPGLHARLAFQ